MASDPMRARGEAARLCFRDTKISLQTTATLLDRDKVRQRRRAALRWLAPSDRRYMELRIKLDADGHHASGES